jgi:hypothetical protein
VVLDVVEVVDLVMANSEDTFEQVRHLYGDVRDHSRLYMSVNRGSRAFGACSRMYSRLAVRTQNDAFGQLRWDGV